MQRLIMVLMVTGLFLRTFAGEGMWIPLLLDSLNYKDMQAKGLRLGPEEIYSINQASLKDAVVIFGGGCTGEVISPEGLILTNHHCGYSRINAHSTVEKNYLFNGFWAGSKDEELANPGLTATFLVKIEDVTSRVLKGVDENLHEQDRLHMITLNINDIKEEALKGTHYEADIKPFFFGKDYYLFVYEVFRDVRLVGTPPEAVGNFGGETDNWIWPRHTGDFSLFRIYADKDNKPAGYSPDNVPYKPKKHLAISTAGVKEGDFTMILGYPGRTEQYLIADAVELLAAKTLPAKIEMRTVRLNTIGEIMSRGPEYKLHYASKNRTIANSWKRWIGVTKGVERANVIERKRRLEQRFDQWASGLADDRSGYSTLMNEFSTVFAEYGPLYAVRDIGSELLSSIELIPLVDRTQIGLNSLADSSKNGKKNVIKGLEQAGRRLFSTSAVEIDSKTLPIILETYAKYTDKSQQPAFYDNIRNNYKGDYKAFVSQIMNNSIFTDSVRYFKTLSKSEKSIKKTLNNDPLVSVYREFSEIMVSDGAYLKLDNLESEMRRLYRRYVTGLMAMDDSRAFYPDANFSMRLTYGKVEGYKPSDAVTYRHYSTLGGILEKEDPEVVDYHVPARLKEMYREGNFGPYTINGDVPVNFIASNHTSGGNSGSPVLNANGNLIGINFDRNWEGTVSDYAYDPNVCRNISVDIRYVLFIIDKLADADWILDELTIVNN